MLTSTPRKQALQTPFLPSLNPLRRASQGTLLGTFLVLGLTLGPPAWADSGEPSSIDIPAQALDEALLAIGRAYGVNVIASEALTSGRQTAALAGKLTVEEALSRLLSDTALVFERLENGTYIVKRGPLDQRATVMPARRIEEIVVRGEKFDRTIQETLSSVSVLEGEVIDASYITDIAQVFQRITNVSNTSAGFSIRGIPERGVGSGTGDTSQTSAVYVDGAVQSQFGGSNGLVSAWDIEQIEVFRGAQTTTQGRAALGGAVVVNTVDPSFEWDGRARIAAGEFGTRQYAAALGGPIVDDILAFRIAVDSNETDGFTEFVTSEGDVLDDIGSTERDLVRAKLLLRAGPSTEAVLSVVHSDSTEGPSLINGPDLSQRRATEVINVADTEITSLALNVTHDISDALALTSVTSYSDLDYRVSPIPETLGSVGVSTTLEATDEALTQELRLNYDAGRGKRGILGVYYNRFDEASQRELGGFFQDSVFTRSDGYDNSFTNYAVFGEGEFDISERLSLTLGARYDVEDSTREENATTTLDPPLPFLPNSSSRFEGDASFDAFLPKVAVTYSFADSISLSALYQRAYRPGGADIRTDTNEPLEFDPEYTNNYELAFRALLFDGSLTLNANAFFVDYTDMQIRVVPDPLNPIARFIDNAGEAELYGFEIDSLWRPSPRLSLYGSLGFAYSELGEFLFQGENLEGNEFPDQPSFNTSIGGSYEFAPGFLITIDTIYSDSFFSLVQNGAGQEVDSYFLTNVRIGYSAENWGLSLYGQNVFDEEYFLSVVGNTPDSDFTGATAGQPQTFGLILEASF